MSRKSAIINSGYKSVFTSSCREKSGFKAEKAVFSMRSAKAKSKSAKVYKGKKGKTRRFYVSKLTDKSLERFRGCSDCVEHPVVFITKKKVGVCMRHWAWLAESNLVWES